MSRSLFLKSMICHAAGRLKEAVWHFCCSCLKLNSHFWSQFQQHVVFQGVVGASTLEALEEAVRKYKVIAKQVEPHTDQAKDIIRRLVYLRMKLFEAKVCRTWFFRKTDKNE